MENVDQEVVDLPVEVIGGPLEKVKPVPDALEHFQRMEKLLPNLRAASVKLTKPQDWVQMGKSVYFQGIGAERVTAMWAIVLGRPDVVMESYPDGTFAYIVTGPCMSRLTGVIYTGVEGGRWSGEDFFERFNEAKPRYEEWQKLTADQKAAWKKEHALPPSPLDVRKAAVTNWQVRCITMLTGLRGLTPEDLAAHGVKAGTNVQFKGGSQGGKATTTNADGKKVFPDAFKEIAGKTVADVPDERLSKLMDYFTKQSGDPAKSRFKAENDAWIEEIEREIERRSRKEA